MSNPSAVYANTFIDALVAAGLRRFCLAPGSRHTALVLALARHRGEVELFSHLDERSVAFFALGLAVATNEAAAVVCTSGSAAANLLPAIVEAKEARLPLIALTADRPHELRHSGANQTIDQVKLFGDFADFFVDAPLPEAQPAPLALRNLRGLAARAVDRANRLRMVAHINLPFRKPFEPDPADEAARTIDRRRPTRFGGGRAPGWGELFALLEAMRGRRGMIYFGHGSCRDEMERGALRRGAAQLARATGWPVLAEFTSNMRGGDAAGYKTLGAYESWLGSANLGLDEVEVLIRFGAPPLCKAMGDFLARDQLRFHVHCAQLPVYSDDSHSLTHQVVFDPAQPPGEVPDITPAAGQRVWRERLEQADALACKTIAAEMDRGPWFDGAVVHDAIALSPAGGRVFAGNSLPVRHLDQFGRAGVEPPFAYANRGASGIDGNVSTALGIAAARPAAPMVALLGDITLYHDMNGLLAARRCNLPITIVLLNNDGGGIFQRLPIRDHEPHFSDYFVTAHGLDFAHAAALYGLEHRRVEDRAAFQRAFRDSLGSPTPTLIEARTDAVADLRRRDEITRTVHEALQSL